jgi:hypothetical protein
MLDRLNWIRTLSLSFKGKRQSNLLNMPIFGRGRRFELCKVASEFIFLFLRAHPRVG